jgi:NAD(P)H-hydrate epimerase
MLPVLELQLLEAVKRPLPEDTAGRLSLRALDPILELSERADAVAIGPGLGRSEGAHELVRKLLETLPMPVVLDADALFGLEPFERAGATVLTPHSGELAGLLGVSAAEVDAHRLSAVRRAASRFGTVVLLKGADTLVAAPRQGVIVAGYGRPALATAGTGDVLTGVVASFLAKGLEPQRAAAAAAVTHGLASRLVEPQPGLIASDLLPGIRRALAGEGREHSAYP